MRRSVLAVAAVAALLGAAGCSKSSETTTSSTTTQGPAATTPATDAPGTTKPKKDDTPGTTAKRKTTTTVGGGKDPDSEYCQAANAMGERFAGYNDIDVMNDPGAFSKALGEGADAAREMADVAPSPIDDDWRTVADAFEQLASVPPDKLFEEMMGMGTEVDDAGQRIDAYTLEQCGFEIDASSGDSGSVGPDDTVPPGDIDPNKVTIDGAQAYLDEYYAGETWIEDLSSWSVSSFGGSATVQVGPASAADAFAVCDAISSYAHQIDEGAVIEVTDASGTVIQRRDGIEGVCEAA